MITWLDWTEQTRINFGAVDASLAVVVYRKKETRRGLWRAAYGNRTGVAGSARTRACGRGRMSSIDLLGISGIRSFGVGTVEQVNFYRPLTIIAGKNGSGKTTIIECLKMALTGELPPNVSRGAAFVHDPSVSDEVETKALIRLEFQDALNHKFFIKRKLQLSNRGARPEFKTVENVISTLMRNTGRKEIMSSRCVDVNEIAPQLMGVSRAVLDNVIFVHQDESLWPLGEHKDLKAKFDAIFESTRYTKALDDIRKRRKELAVQLRVARAELEVWKQRVEQFEKARMEYELLHAQVLELERELAVLVEQMERVEARINTLAAQAEQVRQMHERVTQLEFAVNGKKRELDALRECMKPSTTLEALSDEQMRAQKDDLRAEFEQLAGVQQAHREELGQQKRALAHAEEQIVGISRLEGELRVRQESHDKHRSELRVLMKDMIQSYAQHLGGAGQVTGGANVSSLEGDALVEAGSALLCKLEQRQREMAAAVERKRAEYEELNNRTTERLNSLKYTATSAKRQLQDIKTAITDARSSCMAIRAEGDEVELKHGNEAALMRMIAELNDKASDLTSEIDQLRNRGSGGESLNLSAQIQTKRSAVDRLKVELTALRERRTQFEQAQKLLARIEVVHEQLSQKDSAAAIARRVARDYLLLVTNSHDLEDLRAGFHAYEKDATGQAAGQHDALVLIADQVKRAQKKNEGRVAELTSSVAELSHERAQLISTITQDTEKLQQSIPATVTRLQNILRDGVRHPLCIDTFRALLGDGLDSASEFDVGRITSEHVAEAIDNLDEEEKLATHRVGAESYLETVMERSHKRRRCYLCTRPFSTDAEVEAMDASIDKHRRFLQDQNKASHDHAECRTQLTQIRDALTEYQVVRREREALETNVMDMKKRIQELDHELSPDAHGAQAALSDAEALKEMLATYLTRHYEKFERASADAQQARAELDAMKVGLRESTASNGGDANASVAAVVTLGEQIDLKEKESDALQADLSELFALQQALALREKELADVQAKVERQRSLLDAQQRRTREIDALEREISELETKREGIKSSEARAWKELDTGEAERTAQLSLQRQTLNQLAEEQKKLERGTDRLSTSVATFRASVMEQAAERQHQAVPIAQQIADLAAQKEETMRAIGAMERTLADDARFLADFEGRQRELTDQLRLRALRHELADLSADLSSAQAEVDAARRKSRTSQTPDQDLAHERDAWNKLNSNVHAKQGKLAAIKESEAARKREFDTAAKQGSVLAYRERQGEVLARENALKELDGVYREVDRAIMMYHNMKMAAINNTIRQLWQSTYRGHDIEEIEIVSDVSMQGDAAGGTGGGANARRSYNYRVVMKKSDAVLDMRGRCSAGQKVLACLVIRLALAESFCHACGVLALDEPTTNLDAENMTSLARALSGVIEYRKLQSSFQLVLITHDYHFINELQSKQLATKYCQVYKDREGYSKTCEKFIEDLDRA
ncbi:DNA repair protein RAD50 [Porphyridium purpureum]|uniref:DNA repair protein RAD50 n=1 Tax=Porphyridium purpureum TaxID=35688 RepID=A0A5J4YJS6_PORPP|nr:DNA repair protein RAD50 [Porphyridium purpureum]|eukprot:POR6646..scf210_14